MKNAFFQAVLRAYQCLQEWTDPAFFGSPYEGAFASKTEKKPKKPFFIGRKVSFRF